MTDKEGADLQSRPRSATIYRRCFGCSFGIQAFSEEQCGQCHQYFHPACLPKHLERHARGLPPRPLSFFCHASCDPQMKKGYASPDALREHQRLAHGLEWP